MMKITIELNNFELNELYEAIIAKKNEMCNHGAKLEAKGTSKKILMALYKRIEDLDNVHMKITKSEKEYLASIGN